MLSSIPRLARLSIGYNPLTALPDDFGQRLPCLRALDIVGNNFTAVPRALAGATTLEEIDLGGDDLQVEEPLDWLLEALPRLSKVNVLKALGSPYCSARARSHLQDIGSKLEAKGPEAEFAIGIDSATIGVDSPTLIQQKTRFAVYEVRF